MHTPKIPDTAAARPLLLTLLLLLGSAPVRAQGSRQDPVRGWPVDTLLVRFEREVRVNDPRSFASQFIGAALDLPAPYTSRQDSLLHGLERLALTSDNANVRQLATIKIATAGDIGRTPARTGVLPRLLRIYRTDRSWIVRALIRDQLPRQAERRAAAAFLRSVAAEPDSSAGMGPHGYFSHGDPRIEALARLAEMGEEGRAVLQAMHRSGEARSPQARITLDGMARRGFPVRDAARRQP